MRAIVSTRSDGGVSITYPTREVMQLLAYGAPEGYFGRKLDRDWEIEKFLRAGKPERLATRWIDSIINGGRTTAESYELICEKDTDPSWTGKELWDRVDIPSDRIFRDSWRRSQNGGPIRVDLEDARERMLSRGIKIRERRLAAARVEAERDRILRRFSEARERVAALEADDLFAQIVTATTENALRAAWPTILNGG